MRLAQKSFSDLYRKFHLWKFVNSLRKFLRINGIYGKLSHKRLDLQFNIICWILLFYYAWIPLRELLGTKSLVLIPNHAKLRPLKKIRRNPEYPNWNQEWALESFFITKIIKICKSHSSHQKSSVSKEKLIGKIIYQMRCFSRNRRFRKNNYCFFVIKIWAFW